MWMAEFSHRGDCSVLCLVLIGWLTRLLGLSDGFCGWPCNQLPSYILLFYWRGLCYEYIQVWKSFLFLVSSSSVCFYLSEFWWMGHVGYRIKFAVLVPLDFSNFICLGCIGDRLKFVVLVFFLVSFCLYLMTFLLFLVLSLSDLWVIESCWGTDLVQGPWHCLNAWDFGFK